MLPLDAWGCVSEFLSDRTTCRTIALVNRVLWVMFRGGAVDTTVQSATMARAFGPYLRSISHRLRYARIAWLYGGRNPPAALSDCHHMSQLDITVSMDRLFTTLLPSLPARLCAMSLSVQPGQHTPCIRHTCVIPRDNAVTSFRLSLASLPIDASQLTSLLQLCIPKGTRQLIVDVSHCGLLCVDGCFNAAESLAQYPGLCDITFLCYGMALQEASPEGIHTLGTMIWHHGVIPGHTIGIQGGMGFIAHQW